MTIDETGRISRARKKFTKESPINNGLHPLLHVDCTVKDSTGTCVYKGKKIFTDNLYHQEGDEKRTCFQDQPFAFSSGFPTVHFSGSSESLFIEIDYTEILLSTENP